DAENAHFGHAVALNENGRLIVTANRDDFETSGGACVKEQGSAYLFSRSQKGEVAWSETQKLTPPKKVGRQERMNFGNVLALGPTTALIGAQWYDLGQQKSEGAFTQGSVCTDSPKGFQHEAFVDATNHPAARRFGKHLAMDGNLAAVTNNPWDSTQEPWESGRVYVYTRSPCGDSSLHPFVSSESIEAPSEVPEDPNGDNGFGGEVAVDAGRIAVSQHGAKALSKVHIYHVADDSPSLAGKDKWNLQENETASMPLHDLVESSRTSCFTLISSGTGAQRGTVREAPCQRVLEYTPPANYHGSDTIEYAISDGYGGRAEGTIDVTVEPVDDPPSYVTVPPETVTIDLNNKNKSAWKFDVVGRDIDSEIELSPSGLGDGVQVEVQTMKSGEEKTTWTVTLTATPDGVGRHSLELALGGGGVTKKKTVDVTVYPTSACAQVDCGEGRVCHRGLCLRKVQMEGDTGLTEAEPKSVWGDTGGAGSGRGCRLVPASRRPGPGGQWWWLVVLWVGGLAAVRIR
ncbi:MAG: Ig-like domain-containing protein, partial [Bradymonadaceae bacterium]